jgi:hypothetical protein
MLKDIEQRNSNNEAETLKITAAFESMALLADRRLTERDEQETRLHDLRSEMEEQTEQYEISIKAYAVEAESLRETNARMQAEHEKLISQVETLSATNALEESTPLKQAESPILESMGGLQNSIKRRETQHARDSCELKVCTNADETEDPCGVDLDNGLALREAASRLKYLSDQESPSPRTSKGLRLGKKKQRNLTQQNQPDTGKLLPFPEMGVQQFLWLCALWSLTLLLCRLLS